MQADQMQTILKACEALIETVLHSSEYQEMEGSEDWHIGNDLVLGDAILALREVHDAVQTCHEASQRKDADVDRGFELIPGQQYLYIREVVDKHSCNVNQKPENSVLTYSHESPQVPGYHVFHDERGKNHTVCLYNHIIKAQVTPIVENVVN